MQNFNVVIRFVFVLFFFKYFWNRLINIVTSRYDSKYKFCIKQIIALMFVLSGPKWDSRSPHNFEVLRAKNTTSCLTWPWPFDRSIKHYFLLDQGDLLVQFMDMAEDEMKRSVKDILCLPPSAVNELSSTKTVSGWLIG